MTSCLLCAILLLGCTSSSLEEPRKQEPSSNASSSYGGGLRSSDLATILSSTEFTLEDFSELSQLVNYHGDFLMSELNFNPDEKEWVMHSAKGVNYSLPIKTASIFDNLTPIAWKQQ